MLEDMLKNFSKALDSLLTEEERIEMDFIANLRWLNIIDDEMEDRLVLYFAEKNRAKHDL